MINLISKLTQQDIEIDKILLDPNNPRFIGKKFTGRAKSTNTVAEGRFHEESVQKAALEKMMHQDFDVASVRNSIIQNGFLPLDKIVVRPVGEFYVVVEGNRRIAAIKTLLQQVEDGEVTLAEGAVDSIKILSVLVLNSNEDDAQYDQWLLQGIRHLSGIKDWGPFQKANLINQMFTQGSTVQQIAESLGMTVVMVNRFNRTFHAINQMEAYEDFAQHAGPSLFTHFEEALRIPKIRNYLGWDENEKSFLNESELLEFYSWIIPSDELEGERKFPRGKDVGYLVNILDEPQALEKLKEPKADLKDALLKITNEEENKWREKVKVALKSLSAITLDDIENFTDDDFSAIKQLLEEGEKRYNQALRIKGTDA